MAVGAKGHWQGAWPAVHKAVNTVELVIRSADPALSGQDILSPEEHARLAGMHEGARPAFVTARALLRRKLGAHMGLLPSAVPLAQQGTGRVTIEGFDADEPPYFSVSHTGSADEGIAAVAVTDASPLGIDIQQIDPLMDWQRIAARRYPPDEAGLLAAMPEREGRLLFFTLWAIREAFVKLEDGKLMPYLMQVELDLVSQPARLTSPTPAGRQDAGIWFSYEPKHEMVMAVVSDRPVDIELDCSIIVPSRRPDPLRNHIG